MEKIIFLLLISLNLCQAQSLDALIESAIQENLELKILEKEYQTILAQAPQVSQLENPEIGLGLFPLPVETRLGAQGIRLSATQMLPWFGVLEGKENLVIAKAKTQYESISIRSLQLIDQIKQAYFSLYELEAKKDIIKRSIVLLKSLEQIALAKVESGKTTVADVLNVQLKLIELEQNLALLEIARIQATTSINQLLNREMERPITVQDTLVFADLVYDKNAIINRIAKDHPMVKMYELQAELSRQRLELNHLNGKPSFGLGLDYISVNQRTDANPNNNGRDILQLRAAVKLPLYRQKYEAKEKEENLKIAALSDKKTNVINLFSAEIIQAFAKHEAAQLKVTLYQQQQAITKSTLAILESNYSSAASGFEELLNLQQNLIDYDLKILKAIVESHLAKSTIERFVY